MPRMDASSLAADTTSMCSIASSGRSPYSRVAQFVDRPAERALGQTRHQLGREDRVLERDRHAVGEPDAHQVDDELVLGDAQGRGRLGRRRS